MPKEGKCQICGAIGMLTDDHIPQRALYPKSIRSTISSMNTVKACKNCNNGANEIDELLKVFVGLVADSPWPADLRKSVNSTLNKNKKISRIVEDNSRYEEITLADNSQATARVVKLPEEIRDKFLSAVERLAKAFFYQTYSRVLVEEYEVSVFHPEVIHKNKKEELTRNMARSTWQSVNNETCRYVFVHMDNGDIVFVIRLYETVELFYVIQHKEKQGKGVEVD